MLLDIVMSCYHAQKYSKRGSGESSLWAGDLSVSLETAYEKILGCTKIP